MPKSSRPTSREHDAEPRLSKVNGSEKQTSQQVMSKQQAVARHISPSPSPSPQGSVCAVDEWATALWQFSLQHYPKWQTTLLTWQDRDGLPINLLLFLIFAKQHALDINLTTLQQLWGYTQRSQQQLLQPLRQLRRQLPVLPDIQTGGDALKQALLKAELIAEHAEQRALIQCWLEHNPDSPCRTPQLGTACGATNDTADDTAAAIPSASSAQDALHIHLATLAGYSPHAWHQLLLDLDQVPLNRGG